MRDISGIPGSESELYAFLRRHTGSIFFYERIEPKTEGGFPDIHFCVRRGNRLWPEEGTVELKFASKKKDVRKLIRGSQMANILEYFEAGGRNRYLLAYNGGFLQVYSSHAYYNLVRSNENEPEVNMPWSDVIAALTQLGEFLAITFRSFHGKI